MATGHVATGHAAREQPTDAKRRSFAGRALIWAFAVVAFASCLPTWAGLFARWWWIADLATHFTWHHCFVLPLLIGGCLYTRQSRLAWVVAATLGWNLFQVAPAFLPPSRSPAKDAPSFRVLTQNVYKLNPHRDQVAELILRESPDVACLMELNQGWLNNLQARLRDEYPHAASQIPGTRSGLALFSKHPFAEVRFEELTGINRYCAVATVELAGRDVTILAMHPPRPRGDRFTNYRNAELLAAARLAGNSANPVVMMGDFNTTPWSAVFHDVLQVGDLRDSMRGFGVQPTWRLKNRGPLTLPIDHVLHSPELVTIDRRIGPDVGSDHRAVIVDLADGDEG